MAAVLNPHGAPIPMVAPSLSPSPRSPRLHSVIVPPGFPVRDMAPPSPHPQRVPITTMSPTWQCPCPHPCGGPIPAVSPSSEFPSMRSYKHRSGTIPGPFPPQFSQCPQSLSVPIPVVSPLPFLLCALVAGKTLRSALAWLPRATRKGRDERGAEEACLPPRANTAGGTVWHQHGSRIWQGTLQPLSPHGSWQHPAPCPDIPQAAAAFVPMSPIPLTRLEGAVWVAGAGQLGVPVIGLSVRAVPPSQATLQVGLHDALHRCGAPASAPAPAPGALGSTGKYWERQRGAACPGPPAHCSAPTPYALIPSVSPSR